MDQVNQFCTAVFKWQVQSTLTRYRTVKKTVAVAAFFGEFYNAPNFPWLVTSSACYMLLNCSCTPFCPPRIPTKNIYFVLMPLMWRKAHTGCFFPSPCLDYLWHYLATDGGEIWWRLQGFLWEGDQWNLHSPEQRLQRGGLVRMCNLQALQMSRQHWFAAFGPPATVGRMKK